LLEQARLHLEPQATDAARVRAGLAEQLSNESGVHRSDPGTANVGVSSGARAGRVGSAGASHALVGLATGVVGFMLGLAAERAPSTTPSVASSRPASETLAAHQNPERENLDDTVASRALPPVALLPGAASQEAASREAASQEAASQEAASLVAERTHRVPGRRRQSRPGSLRPVEAPRDGSGETQPGGPDSTDAVVSGAGAGSFDLRAALELLRRAEAARRAGRPSDALVVLAELEANAPDLLAEERLVTGALSECDLGHHARALALARALTRVNQSSIYTRRLRASCVANDLGPNALGPVQVGR
jgi:hypothetical protein